MRILRVQAIQMKLNYAYSKTNMLLSQFAGLRGFCRSCKKRN